MTLLQLIKVLCSATWNGTHNTGAFYSQVKQLVYYERRNRYVNVTINYDL